MSNKSDFITLECPSCGGKLKIKSNVLSYTCDYCGAEHLLRSEEHIGVLETFARCPVCKRNDRVEKVSGIFSKENNEKFSPPIKPYPQTPNTLWYGYPCLLFILWPLAIVTMWLVWSSPISENRKKIVTGVCLLILIIVLMIYSTNMSASEQYIGFSIIIVVFISLVGMLIYWSGLISSSNKIKSDFMKSNKIELWNRSMEKWKELYYCQRDDCVFDPISDKYCSVDDISSLLKIE